MPDTMTHLAYEVTHHPGVPLMGRGGWHLDFEWEEIVPNRGQQACPPQVQPCSCGLLASTAPGLGWKVEFRRLNAHSKRDMRSAATIFWPGGWRRYLGMTPMEARAALHDAVLAFLEPRPCVYALVREWADEEGLEWYDGALLSLEHDKLTRTEAVRSSNPEFDFFDGLRRCLKLLKRPSRVAVGIADDSFRRVETLYTTGDRYGTLPDELRRSVRALARDHAVALRSESDLCQEVLALALCGDPGSGQRSRKKSAPEEPPTPQGPSVCMRDTRDNDKIRP